MTARSMIQGRGIEFNTKRGWIFTDTKEPVTHDQDDAKLLAGDLWLCGQHKSGEELESIVWEFQGIFSTRERAVVACRNSDYFITPVVLNEEWPNEIVEMPGTEYPIASESEAEENA